MVTHNGRLGGWVDCVGSLRCVAGTLPRGSLGRPEWASAFCAPWCGPRRALAGVPCCAPCGCVPGCVPWCARCVSLVVPLRVPLSVLSADDAPGGDRSVALGPCRVTGCQVPGASCPVFRRRPWANLRVILGWAFAFWGVISRSSVGFSLSSGGPPFSFGGFPLCLDRHPHWNLPMAWSQTFICSRFSANALRMHYVWEGYQLWIGRRNP